MSYKLQAGVQRQFLFSSLPPTSLFNRLNSKNRFLSVSYHLFLLW